ncbi:DUF4019 domain-containing protein [Paraburkholderia hospita]|uniref:DUF4019 domain-containing protein n=1 Tax=Paraburkholderia hospita TaxID=169430 RepID=UPI0009A59407|nr:DUF4019 domain-containing protein [Paraburkholderia hospita]SKC49257.1 Protein of unknown function [Paraburkholderia hospita]
MKNLFLKIGALICLSLFSCLSAMAADQDDAAAAAKEILRYLQTAQYERLWDSDTSAFFKSKLTKDSFLANMTMGRAPLGEVKGSQFIDMSYAKVDPTTGYQGEIYAFNYLNTYAVGKFFERIVVLKEKDGKFRLAGLYGAPAKPPQSNK